MNKNLHILLFNLWVEDKIKSYADFWNIRMWLLPSIPVSNNKGSGNKLIEGLAEEVFYCSPTKSSVSVHAISMKLQYIEHEMTLKEQRELLQFLLNKPTLIIET